MQREDGDILTFLKSIRQKKKEVQLIEDEEMELRLSMLPSGIRYDTDKVQITPRDPMPEYSERLEKIEKKESQHKIALLKDIARAQDIINAMPTPEHRMILKLRYLTDKRDQDGKTRQMTWEEIGKIMGFSADHAKGKLHGHAIQEARQIAKNKVKKRKRQNTNKSDSI